MIDFCEFNNKYEINSNEKIDVGKDMYYSAINSKDEESFKVLIKDF